VVIATCDPTTPDRRDILRLQRRVGLLADEGADEGRSDSIQQSGSSALGLVESQCEQTQVVLVNDVNHGRLRLRQAT